MQRLDVIAAQKVIKHPLLKKIDGLAHRPATSMSTLNISNRREW
jgi:hypothetical protein